MARPLLLLLKALLRDAGLNSLPEGGLSSHSLLLMLLACLQRWYNRPLQVPPTNHLGQTLARPEHLK